MALGGDPGPRAPLFNFSLEHCCQISLHGVGRKWQKGESLSGGSMSFFMDDSKVCLTMSLIPQRSSRHAPKRERHGDACCRDCLNISGVTAKWELVLQGTGIFLQRQGVCASTAWCLQMLCPLTLLQKRVPHLPYFLCSLCAALLPFAPEGAGGIYMRRMLCKGAKQVIQEPYPQPPAAV